LGGTQKKKKKRKKKKKKKKDRIRKRDTNSSKRGPGRPLSGKKDTTAKRRGSTAIIYPAINQSFLEKLGICKLTKRGDIGGWGNPGI